MPGVHDIFECQEHELLLNNCGTMPSVLDHQSGLISSFVIAATLLPIGVGAPHLDSNYDSLHLTCHLL